MAISAQTVYAYIHKITVSGLSRDVGMLDENKELFDTIFELAQAIEPCDKYRNGQDRKFWVRIEKGTFEEFSETFKSHFTMTSFEDYLSGKEGVTDYKKMEENWPIMFPEDYCWINVYLSEYMEHRGLSLENKLIIDSREEFFDRKIDMAPLLQWIIEAEKDCIRMIEEGVYEKYLDDNLPYKHRAGLVSQQTYWKYVPEDKENTLRDIDAKEMAEFLAWDDKDAYVNGTPEMTSGDYFRACDFLYDLMGTREKYRRNPEATPKECYEMYSDGRDYGKDGVRLRDLDENSPEAFEEWLDSGFYEHHTWEFCCDPLVQLTPVREGRFFYFALSFHYMGRGEYGKLIHLELAMRHKGLPVRKSSRIVKKILGQQTLFISPHGDYFDTYHNGVRFDETRILPEIYDKKLLEEIQWFPVGEWRLKL